MKLNLPLIFRASLLLLAVSAISVTFIRAQKQCPTQLPIDFGSADLVECNLDSNPDLELLEPACGYSECTGDGSISQRNAWCMCANYSRLGYGQGVYWDCVTARCDCPAPVLNQQPGDGCGVLSGDVANDIFLAPYRVADQDGCDLEVANNCLCLPNSAGLDFEWTWTCDAMDGFQSIQSVGEDSAGNSLMVPGLLLGAAAVLLMI